MPMTVPSQRWLCMTQSSRPSVRPPLSHPDSIANGAVTPAVTTRNWTGCAKPARLRPTMAVNSAAGMNAIGKCTSIGWKRPSQSSSRAAKVWAGSSSAGKAAIAWEWPAISESCAIGMPTPAPPAAARSACTCAASCFALWSLWACAGPDSIANTASSVRKSCR